MDKWHWIDKNQLNAELWNACVAHSKNEHIYGYTWYLDTVAPNWMAFAFGNYTQVFALPVKKKLGISYVFQPEFFQRTSVFYVMEIQQQNELQNLIEKKFPQIDLTSTENIFRSNKTLNNSILKLTNNEIKYNNNTKRNIKKAEKAGLKFLEGKYEDASKSCQLFVGYTKFKLKKEYANNFLKLSETLNKNGALVVRKIEWNQSVIAYAVLAKSKKRITLLQLSVSSKGKKLGASHFLISSCIQEFHGKIDLFDFEGSQNEGINKFYLGFGGELEIYFHYSRNWKEGIATRIRN